MFQRSQTALIIIDLQERLLARMPDAQALADHSQALLEAARILEIPVLASEQYPQGLGPTVPALKALLPEQLIISKHTFSCCREPRFMTALTALQRHQIIICGIEAHVCVLQTAADLIARGYQVQAVVDAISARTAANKSIGLKRIQQIGGCLTSVESCIFELLETSAGPEFKSILTLIK